MQVCYPCPGDNETLSVINDIGSNPPKYTSKKPKPLPPIYNQPIVPPVTDCSNFAYFVDNVIYFYEWLFWGISFLDKVTNDTMLKWVVKKMLEYRVFISLLQALALLEPTPTEEAIELVSGSIATAISIGLKFGAIYGNVVMRAMKANRDGLVSALCAGDGLQALTLWVDTVVGSIGQATEETKQQIKDFLEYVINELGIAEKLNSLTS